MFTRDRRYWLAIKATLYYVFTAVPLRLAFALLVAMILNNSRRLASVYRAAYYTPSIVGGSIAVAVMWREIWGTDKLVNSLLALVGIQGPAWLGNPSTAIWVLIILAAWQFGSPMLIFLAGLKQIPQHLYEAASIDGAGPWAKFLKITLPMLTPIILFNLVMQMIAGFQVFIQAFIVTGGGPLNTTLFYNLYLYRQAYDLLHMGYAAAMAWILLVIIAVFTALVFKSTSYWVFYESEEGR
jgi:multiple sugar transport system permease protein